MHLSPGEAQFAFQWFLNRLIPDQVEKLDLAIYVRKMDIDSGRCWAYQDHPRKFIVVVNSKNNYHKMISSIAHECVHIEQYVTGKLKKIWRDDRAKHALWRKKIFVETYEGRTYRDSPWEKDARVREKKLMCAYLRFKKRSS